MPQLSAQELTQLKEMISSDNSTVRFISTPWGIIDKQNIPDSLKSN